MFVSESAEALQFIFSQMADPRIRQLVIKTGVVKRLSKEKTVYEKEVNTELARLDKFKSNGADDHVLRKQEEVIQECQMMIPDSKRRLQKEYDVLEKYLQDEQDLKETEAYTKAAETERHTQDITLKKLHDASNILKTFDLLERLYKARGANNDLGQKLAQMRTVWRRVKQESENATGTKGPANLEEHWDQVIFGSSCSPLEQRRGQKKQQQRELLQRRLVWDSYICNGKRSSCIPGGWVLPPENPMPEWALFRVE
ncbi:hypothetical protein ACLKA7_009390 [Drosophila subpalustris]